MATLFLNHNGIWYLNYRVNGKRVRVSTKTTKRQLAELKLRDLEARLFRNEISGAPSERMSVADFFDRFREHMKQNYSKANAYSELARLGVWHNYFVGGSGGIKYIDQINAKLVADFQATVLCGKKPKTVRNYIALLKTMLGYAVKWELLDKNPIADVALGRVVRSFRFFSKEETRVLIEEASEPLKTAIIILVNTGLRRGELYNLRWRDVDLKARTLRVWPHADYVPKSKKARSVPINDALLAALKSLEKSETYVWRPFTAQYRITAHFTRLVRQLGLTGTLHDLRHTFASHLAMENVPIPVIKELLGHSDISTTMIYAHLSPHMHKAAVDRLKF